MVATIASDCSTITLTTPESGYIEHINTPIASTCCHELDLGINCCTPLTEFCVPTSFTLGTSITGCGTEFLADVLYAYIDVTVSGIDAICVEELEYTSFISGANSVEENPTDLIIRFYNVQQGDNDIEIFIRTCENECLEYKLEFTINISNILDHCNTYTLGAVTQTSPTIPSGITVNMSNEMILTPEAFGLAESIFPDGIYFISLSENGVPETVSVFVNCNTQCQILDYVSLDTCSNLYAMYEALVYSINCGTITYSQQCLIWEYIGKKLGYFKNSPCETVSDCGCN